MDTLMMHTYTICPIKQRAGQKVRTMIKKPENLIVAGLTLEDQTRFLFLANSIFFSSFSASSSENATHNRGPNTVNA